MTNETKKQYRININVRKEGLHKKIKALKIEENFNISDFCCKALEKEIKKINRDKK